MNSQYPDSLLPVNARPFERAVESVVARSLDLPVPITSLWQASQCPESLLPWLAWALGVDDWNSEWPVSVKRKVIHNSFNVYREMGTPAAVYRVLDAVGIKAELTEWFQSGDAPFTFDVMAWANANMGSSGESVLNPSSYSRIRRLIDRVKPVRSHYRFRIGARFDSDLLLSVANLQWTQMVRRDGVGQASPVCIASVSTAVVDISILSVIRIRLESVV